MRKVIQIEEHHSRDVKAGEIFTEENIRSVRLAHGLHTKYYGQIPRSGAAVDIEAGEPLEWNKIIN